MENSEGGTDLSEVKNPQEIAEIREKLNDPNYLPTHEDIKSAFGSSNSSKDEWDKFCENPERHVFEFVNKEYIEVLANYLQERAKELKGNGEPLVILEVGAGNGRLSHFLDERLKMLNPEQFKVVATDDNSWNLKPDFAVENITNNEALAKYQPDIIISSWMPYNVDFTQDFRNAKSVMEYILIGEDNGCTGKQWETWGSPTSQMFEEDLEDSTPPFEADGFRKERLEDLSELNLSKVSDPRWLDSATDSTISFRRD